MNLTEYLYSPTAHTVHIIMDIVVVIALVIIVYEGKEVIKCLLKDLEK